MGKAAAFFDDDAQSSFSNGFDLKLNEFETAVAVGNKTYVICGTDDPTSSGVRIYNKLNGEWVIPTVLGTKPESFKGHSCVLLNKDRILIMKHNSKSSESVWFLEVDTQFIRDQKKKLGTEVVGWSKGVIGNADRPLVISGPSGVGKGTLINMLMKEFPSMFGFSVSHTTRAPREKEQNGVHYHFIKRNIMEEDIRSGKFLEFAAVHGNIYGTSIEAVDVVADAGKRCILDIDVQGARSVRASSLEATFIFVCPPSFEELEKRLRARFKSFLRGVTLLNTASKVFDLPVDFSFSKINEKILINHGAAEQKVLDLSSMKGGVPGRTRGLDMYAYHP